MQTLHPFCQVCGWRKGGVDSWNGRACKCGHSEPAMPPIHVNLDDEVQVNALFSVAAYIKANPGLTADEIRELRQFVHNVRGDAQHDRERRLDQREPKDPQDWSRS